MGGAKNSPRRGRRAYLDDFQLGGGVGYEYTGQTYALQSGAPSQRVLSRRLLGLSTAVLAACLVSACVRAPGAANCAYILLPYLGSLLSCVSLLCGSLKLWWGDDPLRQYTYDVTVKQFPLRTVLTAVFSALTMAAQCIYAALNGVGGMAGGMAVFLLSQACVLAGALLFRRLAGAAVWAPQLKGRSGEK